MRALDWFHCRLFDGDPSKFTWGEFLRGAVYCTNEQGSALFDATLGDADLLEDMYKDAVKKQSSKRRDPADDQPYHPSRRGYTREVEATLDVADNLIALRAEMGKWRSSTTRMSARPLLPAQAVEERLRQRNISKRDEKIRAAQQRWDRENDPTKPA